MAENREPTIDITRRDKWLVGESKSIAQSAVTCKFTGPKEVADRLITAFETIASAAKPEGRQLSLPQLVDGGRRPAPSGEAEGNIIDLPATD